VHCAVQTFKTPYAYFPLNGKDCDVEKFHKQSIIFDTTLCGQGQGPRFATACEAADNSVCDNSCDNTSCALNATK
jgi:hypothetical protein